MRWCVGPLFRLEAPVRLTMNLNWAYNQVRSLKRLEIDHALRKGVCGAMTYEWIKRQLVGLKTTPAVVENSIFRIASMQRAGGARIGHVAQVRMMLEGQQSQRRTQRNLTRVTEASSVENIARFAVRDGLIASVKTDALGFGDLLKNVPPGGTTEFTLADDDEVLEASSEFSRVLGSGRPIAAYLSLRSAGGGHAVGILASSKGATFFDPNFGEYHNQNAFLGLLWVFCSHVPARYGVRYNALMATRLEGTPRDAAFLAQV